MNSYALLDEIKSASDTRKNKAKPTLTAIVGGKIVKKYRCASALSRHLGISRKALTKSSGISKNFDMANFHNLNGVCQKSESRSRTWLSHFSFVMITAEYLLEKLMLQRQVKDIRPREC